MHADPEIPDLFELNPSAPLDDESRGSRARAFTESTPTGPRADLGVDGRAGTRGLTELDDILGPDSSNVTLEVHAARVVLPTGVTPAAGAFPVTRDQLLDTARYPVTPESLWGAAPYAWGVQSRRRSLRQRLRLAREALAQAEDGRDRELVRFVHGLRPMLAEHRRFARLVETLAAEDLRVTETESLLSGSKGEALAAEAAFVERERELQAGTAETGAQLAAQEAETRKHGDVFRRVETQWKRFGIEIRAAKERAENTGEDTTNDVASFQMQAEALRPTVDVSRQRFDQARARQRATEEAQRGLQRDLSALREERRSETFALEQAAGNARQALSEAKRDGRRGYADVGRELLASPETWDPASVDLESLRRADAEVRPHALEVTTLERALACYDTEVYRRGVLVIATGGGSLLVAILLLAYLALR